ncbi:MAG: hypothetical protein AUJ31_00515 [Parcubacteria group bacterium CG1_02_39_15]|uniref:Uncharacterized protein n=4 Tax=Candidatus Nealsoniibacteriota TaxID=1817911 RepID=A0A2G9YS44_9BACT|nr:MAG: hypothetical protein AUJ31_00515 [Parcubacteria group bacterium CG1_02_39_15]PIP22060.1 MAG: hypothetical protein COX38_02785 [Candidatus Nealsonbacteria bacterium CG23_combo_of_CG06-09_8_20_14_all_39_25]PIQ98415.1 MAG: hypothetical protein COV64_01375 [Candidatus Nealsonbacteria bacterium CG11_big_fil_rev_8_21_14_0_20_39_9]PIW90472.1 MAG: hypothetical protein COZ92_00660 [Candidatus Nealsonbacteria bacterium CG_4_8_14_3_um_filter_40_11]PIZ88221.1 MAG: hypothetical protein COX91_01315 [
MKLRDLEEVKREVEEIRDESGKRVDEKIKPLVIGLRRWGINTEFSCQGHRRSKSEVLSFPSVEISPKDYKKVKKLISAFGGNSWILKKERWSTKEGIPKITLRLVPRNKNGRKLIRMQKDAIEFGKFLQELPEDWFKRNKL